MDRPRHEPDPRVAALLARCSFPPAGTAVNCAVSGGADSLALMVLAVAAGCSVTAIHVDHGLRADSAGEADIVASASVRFGAQFRAERIELAGGPNLEARAREARYAVLPSDVMLGHTADDQAETILINMLRGAGVGGLTGMRRDARRPLLDLRRHETRDLCAGLELAALDDPMNHDPSFTRVRVRHELLPLLDDIGARDLVPLLCRQGALAADAVDALDALTESLDASDARALARAPVALARWAARRWLRAQTGSDHPPSAAAIDRVLAVARGDSVATEIEGGWRVARSHNRLHVTTAR
jgi:tRNA(Ile)-lysidine synthase